MKAEVLCEGVGTEGGEYGQHLSRLSHGVTFCGSSDPSHPHHHDCQAQVARGKMWGVWVGHGGGEVQP